MKPVALCVFDAMTPDPVSVSPSTSLDDAAQLMRELHCRHLPVVENDRVYGVVSSGDIRGGLAHTVAEIMTKDPMTVEPSDRIEVAAATMGAHKIGCLLVMDGVKLVGIITTYDMLDALAQTMRMWRASAIGGARDKFTELLEQGAEAVTWGDYVESASELSDVLLERGTITPEQLQHAKARASSFPEPVTPEELLLREGEVSTDEFEAAKEELQSKRPFVDIVAERAGLDEKSVETLRRHCESGPPAALRALFVDSGLVSDEDFLKSVHDRYCIPFIPPEEISAAMVSPQLLRQISLPYMKFHGILPLAIVDDRLITVLVNPLNDELDRVLTMLFRLPVERCSTTEARFQELIEELEGASGKSASAPSEHQEERIEEATPAPEPTAADQFDRVVRGDAERTHVLREIVAPARERAAQREQGVVPAKPRKAVVSLQQKLGEDDNEEDRDAISFVEKMLTHAVRAGASDVHVDALPDRYLVRIRIDGALEPIAQVASQLGIRVVSRLKVLAGADVAQRRSHQDGRAVFLAEGRDLEVRFSSYVSVDGESVVLRILDYQKGLLPIDRLGVVAPALEALRVSALSAGSGFILITGPTGSGKTTTMFSIVDSLRESSVKLISCEDPVEYRLEGMVQCSVARGRSFPDSLRAMMRQDPDIIVVGEVRDGETARLATEAGLTGHKVFSTFHTDDSVGAIVRLIEMGVEPFVLASALSIVIGQRLVRRVCKVCAEIREPSNELLRTLNITREDIAEYEFQIGIGCAKCRRTGYRGRVGIHEVLVISDDLRDAIIERSASTKLRHIARNGRTFFTLREDALIKAMAGYTTLEEVAHNTPSDEHQRGPQQLREFL